MLGKNKAQFDVFDNIIFDKLIPKNHLLVEIDEVVDFSFVYEQLKDNYSPIGRESKDPVMMFKILILEYLYCLSDPKAVERVKTDVAFRWFLGLNLMIQYQTIQQLVILELIMLEKKNSKNSSMKL